MVPPTVAPIGDMFLPTWSAPSSRKDLAPRGETGLGRWRLIAGVSCSAENLKERDERLARADGPFLVLMLIDLALATSRPHPLHHG